jgi:peptidoglycan/xylan/chitin deacetylase (PgdA/CDA1 family)
MRAALKGLVEDLLVHGGPATVARSTRRGRTLVLAYHNIVPHGAEAAGDRSLHLPQARFAAQLELLRGWADVVPLDALREPARPGDRPRVVITFDDAYRGAVTAGVAELAARGLPGTIFVCPGLLGDHAFWWDRLATAQGLPDDVRRYAIEDLHGQDERIIGWARGRGLPIHEPPAWCRSATEAELHAALARGGITVASHTWSHPNLTRVPTADLQDEYRRSRAWLEERFGSAHVPWLSYPYGAYASRVAWQAYGLGFTGAFRVEGGWMGRIRRAEYHRMPRLNVPAGISDAGFSLRVAGLRSR